MAREWHHQEAEGKVYLFVASYDEDEDENED